jgi:hypothetical protein
VAEIAYLDFDLEIDRTAQGYRVEINSPAGQTAAAFTLPFSNLELENFSLRIGQNWRGMRRAGSPEVESAKAFGTRLFDAVFVGEARACLRSSLDEVRAQGKGLRIRLRLNDVPELADIPWEYLYNSSLNRFLALSAETPIVRYLELPESIRPLAIAPPLRVLVMIASPRDQAPLDVEREWALLQQALGDLKVRGLVMLERLEEPSLPALQRRLRRGSYHILHFIGHGSFDPRAEDGGVILEDENGSGYRISGQDLGMLLHDHRSLRLVVLNACEGARASLTDPFAGAAQSLVQQGLPAVIAMQFAVSDEAAIDLSREFYGALADGYPVDASLAEARKAIFATGSGVEWGTPVLYLRAPDGKIFDVAPTAEAALQPSPPTHSGSADPQGTPVEDSRMSVQARLAALGCQASLMVQIAALVVVVIGAGLLYASILGGQVSSVFSVITSGLGPGIDQTNTALPTISAPTLALPSAAGISQPPALPVATPITNAPTPPTVVTPPELNTTPETFAGWKQLVNIPIDREINTIAFSPDGKLLAVSTSDDVFVRLGNGADGSDLANNKLRSGGAKNDRVTSLAFSPDGELLAAGNGDGSIQIWSVADRRSIRLMIDFDDIARKAVQSLAFSHNGELIISGNDDTAVRL